jgi:hypothetical protein
MYRITPMHSGLAGRLTGTLDNHILFTRTARHPLGAFPFPWSEGKNPLALARETLGPVRAVYVPKLVNVLDDRP